MLNRFFGLYHIFMTFTNVKLTMHLVHEQDTSVAIISM